MTDIERYRELRAEGYLPSYARDFAEKPAPREYQDHGDHAVLVHNESWTVRIRYEADEIVPQPLGHFTHDPHPDAIRVGRQSDPMVAMGAYPFFVPATTWRAHRDGLSRIGHSRHEADCMARRYVREDMLIQLGLAYPPYAVTVAVGMDGDTGWTMLGVASVGAVVFHREDPPTLAEVVDYAFNTGMVEDAIEDGRAVMAQLVGAEQL